LIQNLTEVEEAIAIMQPIFYGALTVLIVAGALFFAAGIYFKWEANKFNKTQAATKAQLYEAALQENRVLKQRMVELNNEGELLKKRIEENKTNLDKAVDERLQELKGVVYEKILPITRQADRLYYFDYKTGLVVSIPKSTYK